MVYATWIAPICSKLAASERYDFRLTLEDLCRATELRLRLAPPVTTHGVAGMVREELFATRDYASLIAGARDLLFIEHMKAAAKKLRAKARLLENASRCNACPSMVESSHILEIYSGPYHVNWVTEET